MKVIIPAAGSGSRLRPHTYTVPKSLLQVAGKPIIGHILDRVISWGGDRIVMIVGHLRKQLEEYVRDNYRFEAEFREQERNLGLGHAVMTGLDPEDRELLVVLGDTIIETDLEPVISRGTTAIGVREVDDPRRFGVVVVEGGRVTRLVEKPPEPPSNLAIVGIYYFRDASRLSKAIAEVIERKITVKGEYQITDALQLLLEWGEPMETFPVEGWYDCGCPETLLETNRHLFDRLGGDFSLAQLVDSTVIPPVALAKGTRIERSVIGPYVTIERNAIILDSIVRDAIIGSDARISRLLLENTIVGARARLSGEFQRLNIGASSHIDS